MFPSDQHCASGAEKYEITDYRSITQVMYVVMMEMRALVSCNSVNRYLKQ